MSFFLNKSAGLDRLSLFPPGACNEVDPGTTLFPKRLNLVVVLLKRRTHAMDVRFMEYIMYHRFFSAANQEKGDTVKYGSLRKFT